MTSLTRRRGEAEESEEGYFASVSDLMVGILFVFLLLLTVFALNFRDAESKQMVERARPVAAPAQAEQNPLEAEHHQAQAREGCQPPYARLARRCRASARTRA